MIRKQSRRVVVVVLFAVATVVAVGVLVAVWSSPRQTANRTVKAYLRENCHDPKKFEIVKIGPSHDAAKCFHFWPDEPIVRKFPQYWVPLEEPTGTLVLVRWRDGNPLGGGSLLQEAWLHVNPKQQVVGAYPAEDISTKKPVRKAPAPAAPKSPTKALH